MSVDQPVGHPYGFGFETGSYGNMKIPGSLCTSLAPRLSACQPFVIRRSSFVSIAGGCQWTAACLLLHRIEVRLGQADSLRLRGLPRSRPEALQSLILYSV